MGRTDELPPKQHSRRKPYPAYRSKLSPMRWEEHTPFFKARRNGLTSPQDENRFVLRNRGLYMMIVKKWGGNFDPDEAESLASYAFARAMDAYDPDNPRGVHFSGFLNGVARQVFTDELRRIQADKRRMGVYAASLSYASHRDGYRIIRLTSNARDVLPVELILDREGLLDTMDSCLNDREYSVISLAYELPSTAIDYESVGLNDVQIANALGIKRQIVQVVRNGALQKIKLECERKLIRAEANQSIRNLVG